MASLFIVERSRMRSSWIDMDSGLTGNRYPWRPPTQNSEFHDNFKSELIIDFIGPNPNCIDINGDLGLGFSVRSQEAIISMKIKGLFYGRPLC